MEQNKILEGKVLNIGHAEEQINSHDESSKIAPKTSKSGSIFGWLISSSIAALGFYYFVPTAITTAAYKLIISYITTKVLGLNPINLLTSLLTSSKEEKQWLNVSIDNDNLLGIDNILVEVLNETSANLYIRLINANTHIPIMEFIKIIKPSTSTTGTNTTESFHQHASKDDGSLRTLTKQQFEDLF